MFLILRLFGKLANINPVKFFIKIQPEVFDWYF